MKEYTSCSQRMKFFSFTLKAPLIRSLSIGQHRCNILSNIVGSQPETAWDSICLLILFWLSTREDVFRYLNFSELCRNLEMVSRWKEEYKFRGSLVVHEWRPGQIMILAQSNMPQNERFLISKGISRNIAYRAFAATLNYTFFKGYCSNASN